MAKDFYMACLDVAGRRCVVVGGGSVGLEKASGLAACGASVAVVSPDLDPRFADLGVEWTRRRYRTGDLEGAFIAIAATSDRSVNEHVFADAEKRGMLCNVADVPDLCNFILPAVHREGPIAVAVSTGGASPALAKRLRSQIAELVRPEHAELAEELRAMRPEVKERFETYEERRDYFEDVVTARLA
ncbi:MAG TPA: bifunctional precorrin-2 dehydrogenase/sirohydrochlorin ferrochelatase [Gaiellaceae bacterium]